MQFTNKILFSIGLLVTGAALLVLSQFIVLQSGTVVLNETLLPITVGSAELQRQLALDKSHSPYVLLVRVKERNGQYNTGRKLDPFSYFVTYSFADSELPAVAEQPQITQITSAFSWNKLGELNVFSSGKHNLRFKVQLTRNREDVKIEHVEILIKSGGIRTEIISVVAVVLVTIGFTVFFHEAYKQNVRPKHLS